MAVGQQQEIYNSDSTLSNQFVASICQSVVDYSDPLSEPTYFEILINRAASTYHGDTIQNQKILTWWNRHYNKLYCPARRSEEIHLSRLFVENDTRLISNQLGPRGRLTIDVERKDSRDGLSLREYALNEREKIEEKYRHQTLKFQKNKKWKNYTFYMLLFTEYEVQWAVLRDEEGKNK